MVLINTLTVEAINTALLALQKGQSIVIGGEKGNTVNNITVTNNGGSSGIDYAPLISAVGNRVGLLEKAQKVYEQIQAEQKAKIAALEKLGIQEVEYNDATRELSIRTKDGKTYSTTFPEPYVALDIEGSDLILTSGNVITSVTLPFVLASEKGQPNGVATLDSMGRVPYSQLPESAMEFKGEWDASTNTPELEDGVGTNGDFYICSAGGTVTFGTGHTETFIPNDRVLYNGETEEWVKLPAGQVQSVNGMTGDVVLNIPPAQIQSDWTQTDNTAKDFIKHKLPIWVTQGVPSDNMQPIDSVTDGEMRPVTSNAVYDKHYLTSADVVDQVTLNNMQSVSSNAVAQKFGWKLVGEVRGSVSIPINFDDYDEVLIISNVGYYRFGTVYCCSQSFPASYLKSHLGEYAWGFGGKLNSSTPYGYRTRVTVSQNNILPDQALYDNADFLDSTLFSVYAR